MELKSKKYLDILKENKSLESKFKELSFNIFVIGNITLNKIKDILEYPLRSNDIPAIVEIGNYDNAIQDSLNSSGKDVVIIHLELQNYFADISINSQSWTNQDYESTKNEILAQIGLILENLKKNKLIIFNLFSTFSFPSSSIIRSNLQKIEIELNAFLYNQLEKYNNLRLVDINRITAKIGSNDSFDLKSYYLYKDLYRPKWFIEYVEEIQHLIYSISGKIKKALIVDCDNTLWKGILGEDGFDNIDMSKNSKSGQFFHFAQNSILQLSKKGILIGLCSKNNFEDVNEVISKHPDFLLPDELITFKKVNWIDKATNISEISDELNIGTDSFVYLDDSDFEVNLIKEKLPEVRCFQVPKNLSEYPDLFNSINNYFFRHQITNDDLSKAKEYKLQAKRSEDKISFSNIDDYIKSLNIEITVFKNSIENLQRMEQMAQKTNQFNFTTIRHTSTEIENFISNVNFDTYCLNVRDKYGDSGITGLLILEKNPNEKSANILTFLMSCRIIGRNIEFSFLNHIFNDLKKQGYQKINATYLKTKKNAQILNFFDQLNFKLTSQNENQKKYESKIDEIIFKNIDYIGVIDG